MYNDKWKHQQHQYGRWPRKSQYDGGLPPSRQHCRQPYRLDPVEYPMEYQEHPPLYQRVADALSSVGTRKKKEVVKCSNVEYKTAELLGNYQELSTGEVVADMELFQMLNGG